MKKLALGALFVGLLAACGGGSDSKKIIVVDGNDGDANLTCSPLTQAGCATGQKCTWIIDATTPMYVGHIGCEAAGSAAVGAACMFGAAGATGFDNCAAGAVCSAFGTPMTQGTCKQICDQQGGNPMCDASHVCVQYSRLFSTGPTSPAAAGVCDLACDPLADNDFDGSGAQTKSGTTCGSNARIGCYGGPSGGTPPATGWSCTGDVDTVLGSDGTITDDNLRHRANCTSADNCADTDGTIYINSCNQGYLPLFYDKTGSTVVDCVAMCQPAPCYDGSGGHCGSTSSTVNGQQIWVNQVGAGMHRCKAPDFVVGVGGTTSPHESCQYLWADEIDGSGNLLVSPTSDTVGFCYDHSRYTYDPDGSGGNAPITEPDCDQLQLEGTFDMTNGSGGDPNDPLTYFGAVDFGCVDSTTAGFGSGSATGKRRVMRNIPYLDRPHTLYHRVMTAK